MNSRPDKTSPFGINIWMSKNEMDFICLKALRESKRYLPASPQPINIDRFLESYIGVQFDYQDLPQGYLGCAMFAPTGKPLQVVLSERLLEDRKPTERRLRSTLAHEAGHCLFHTTLFMEGNPQSELFDQDVDLKQRRILCRDAVASGSNGQFDGRWWEYQANRAIGGLLLPRHLVDMVLEGLLSTSFLGASSLPSSARKEAVDRVSDVFDVNPVVARYRLQEFYPADDKQLTL